MKTDVPGKTKEGSKVSSDEGSIPSGVVQTPKSKPCTHPEKGYCGYRKSQTLVDKEPGLCTESTHDLFVCPFDLVGKKIGELVSKDTEKKKRPFFRSRRIF